MRAIVVYYSLEGNTRYAAQRIAKAIGADLLELRPQKAYPTGGIRKFVWGGKSAVMSESPKLLPYEFDAAAYDLVVIGFPVWASTIAPPIRSFAKEHDLSGVRVAAFACQAGNGAERALAKLRECLGKDALAAELVLVDPKDRPSEENDRGIETFCDALR